MMSRSQTAEVEALERLATRMDSAFRVPGTRFRIGLDAILGIIPGIGDVLTLAPSLYIVWKAHGLGVRWPRLLRMGGNVALDSLIGAVPVIGDLFDAGFKANRRNVALIRTHMETADAPSIYEKGPRNRAARIHSRVMAL